MTARERAEVVIVGAGAAGLAAARALSVAGKHVVMIEARERVGGRIYSHHLPACSSRERGLAVELGAEFVHGLPAVSWSLIREAQLATFELQGEPFCFDGKHLDHCDDGTRDPSGSLQRMQEWLDRSSAADVSFESYLQAAQVDTVSANRAAAYVEGFNAADRRIVSAAALMRQQRAEDRMEGDRIFHVRSGYDALPAYLAECAARAGARIMLGACAREVCWKSGSVIVRGQDAKGGAFLVEAAQAIVTLPLGVLQANAVAFDPAPLDMVGRWHSLAMGTAERITLLFDRQFWRDRAPGLGFLLAPTELIPTWWTSMPEPTPLITGWAGGAHSMSRWNAAGLDGEAALQQAALRSFAKIFDLRESDLRRWLVSVHHHRWAADPFSRGSYSYVAVGGLEAARMLSEPLQDTLFFAGEHTDLEDQWGTVHAALSSGVRAARQLLERPPLRL